MENQDRQVIQGLFGRLDDVARQAPPRDVAAEEFINQQVAQQPAAPYYMAQTIVMQEYALNQAQQKIEELERSAQERPSGGGIFSALFGGGQKNAPERRLGANAARAPVAPPAGGGGFLAGAAQTAMGVAGGVLLGNAIAGMFGGNDAAAAENTEEPPPEENVSEEGGGFDDGGFGDDL
ncbi:DUF2076 domain-containing protein [Steroidobacter sp.]|uniref:DUF2076 domain-containing protein n=1 Tax=Steroidobacter sp. TaxID=1978227 RepID=UPI001A513598|nr:DUF2076 domain-containing protein [Steroidobacter sp.]MBL8271135.1 DUF2076 domain-containing protein [Steroidobacter sp.]